MAEQVNGENIILFPIFLFLYIWIWNIFKITVKVGIWANVTMHGSFAKSAEIKTLLEFDTLEWK